jgi:hypothetical protein
VNQTTSIEAFIEGAPDWAVYTNGSSEA